MGSLKDIVKKMKRQPRECKKCLQSIYSTKDLYPDYLNNAYNAIIKRQTIQFKNEWKNWTDTSLVTVYKLHEKM